MALGNPKEEWQKNATRMEPRVEKGVQIIDYRSKSKVNKLIKQIKVKRTIYNENIEIAQTLSDIAGFCGHLNAEETLILDELEIDVFLKQTFRKSVDEK